MFFLYTLPAPSSEFNSIVFHRFMHKFFLYIRNMFSLDSPNYSYAFILSNNLISLNKFRSMSRAGWLIMNPSEGIMVLRCARVRRKRNFEINAAVNVNKRLEQVKLPVSLNTFATLDALPSNPILSVPKFTANLYCICLSEHETCAYADAVQICGNIWNA